MPFNIDHSYSSFTIILSNNTSLYLFNFTFPKILKYQAIKFYKKVGGIVLTIIKCITLLIASELIIVSLPNINVPGFFFSSYLAVFAFFLIYFANLSLKHTADQVRYGVLSILLAHLSNVSQNKITTIVDRLFQSKSRQSFLYLTSVLQHRQKPLILLKYFQKNLYQIHIKNKVSSAYCSSFKSIPSSSISRPLISLFSAHFICH